MSNLENLISKITKESEQKAELTIKDAKVQAQKIIDDKVQSAMEQKNKIMQEAKVEAERAKSQIISGKKLEIRDNQLKAKQEMIDTTFNLAYEDLKQLPKDKFAKFLGNYLLSLDIVGDEQIILPKSMSDIDLTDLNEKLFEKGKKGVLSIANEDREIESGFILIKDGKENNNSFSTLLNYYREILEGEIVSMLF